MIPKQILKKLIWSFVTTFLLLRLFNKKSVIRYGRYCLNRYFLRKKIPGIAVIALTFKCQCNCVCCSSNIFRNYYDNFTQMPLADIKIIINKIADLGVPRIHFTGGEPLLRKDIVSIVKICSERGLLTFVETNGLLLTEVLVLALKEAGVSCINISLDSIDYDRHDSARVLQGCYEKAIAAIKLCVKHCQNCMISTYATKKNIHNKDLSKIIRLAKELGCFGIRILASQPAGKWIGKEEVILNKNDIRMVEEILPINFLVLNRTRLIKCPMKNGYKLFILPDGNIAPCEHLPFIFKDSKDIDMAKIADKINSYEMFRDEYRCLPRDRKFIKRYLDGKISASDHPLFI